MGVSSPRPRGLSGITESRIRLRPSRGDHRQVFGGTLTAMCAAAIVFAALAAADSVTKYDAKNDVRGVPKGAGFDLKAATATHGASGRMVHRVASYYGDPAGFAYVRLELDTDQRPGADWYVKKTGRGAAIVNAYTGKRAGSATFDRLSSRRFSFAFGLSAFGHPPSYRWRWAVVRNRTIDVLPERGFVTHTMPRPND